MEKIKLTFLGTSYSIPTKHRNHSSILLSYKNENILVDCGEGTQRQFSKADLNPCKITRILITHWHGDHILGLPGLLQTMSMLGYNKELKIYTPEGTKKFMERIMQMFVFVGKIKYSVEEVSNKKIIETPDFFIEAFTLSHGVPCNGYSFTEKEKLRIDKRKLEKLRLPSSPLIRKLSEGKNIKIKNRLIKASTLTYKQKGRKISFVLDTGYNNFIQNKVKNSDILITESTYINKDEALAKRYHHLTAEQAATIAKKSKSKKLILMHISSRYPKVKEIEEEAKRKFKNTILAEDLQIITI